MGWAPSSVRAILTNPVYHGQRIWNRTKKRNVWGVRHTTDKPGTEWIVTEAPAIVSEDLWQAVEQRRRQNAHVYANGVTCAAADMRLPNTTRAPKYLLAGFAKCAVCGGGMIVTSRSHGSGAGEGC